MSSTATQSSLPSTSELIEGVLFYPIALVVSATIVPGMVLCVPALVFVAALVLIPRFASAAQSPGVCRRFCAPSTSGDKRANPYRPTRGLHLAGLLC
jgi:hypothetical protein